MFPNSVWLLLVRLRHGKVRLLFNNEMITFICEITYCTFLIVTKA